MASRTVSLCRGQHFLLHFYLRKQITCLTHSLSLELRPNPVVCPSVFILIEQINILKKNLFGLLGFFC